MLFQAGLTSFSLISLILNLYLTLVFLSILDGISERNPRVIDEARARKLASDLKRCSYYETCATYGLNVERVFQDGKHLQKKNTSFNLKTFSIQQ